MTARTEALRKAKVAERENLPSQQPPRRSRFANRKAPGKPTKLKSSNTVKSSVKNAHGKASPKEEGSIREIEPDTSNVSQNSLLFHLPPELRNRIYDMVFDDGYVFGMMKPRHWAKYRIVQHPMTLVCQQLRAESLPLFLNRFTLSLSTNQHVKPACRLLAAFGARSCTRMAISMGINITGTGENAMICSTRHWAQKSKAQVVVGGSVELLSDGKDKEVGYVTNGMLTKPLLQTLESMGISLSFARLHGPEPQPGLDIEQEARADQLSSPTADYGPPFRPRKRAGPKRELFAVMSRPSEDSEMGEMEL